MKSLSDRRHPLFGLCLRSSIPIGVNEPLGYDGWSQSTGTTGFVAVVSCHSSPPEGERFDSMIAVTSPHFSGRGSSSIISTMAICLLVLATLFVSGRAQAQMRIVNYNIAQLQGNIGNMQDVFTAMHADDKPGFAVPVSIFVFQEVQGPDFNSLLTMLNNTAPPGVDYLGGTFTTTTNEDGSGGAQALFYRVGMFTQAGHLDIATGAGRNTDRWQLNLTGYPGVSIYVYGSHLKADNSPADEAARLSGVQAIRNNSNALGNAHIVYTGDFNFYHNMESAYTFFLSAGNGQAFDPLGTGSWAGSGNAIKHTQSPRLDTGVLIGGGMDDRFDFQISTGEFQDGAGLSIMSGLPSIYRTFGNDGQHYDQAINNGNNFYYPFDTFRSNSLALDLFNASDHIPTIVDYQIPAVMAGFIEPDFGRVIQGASVQIPIEVTNEAVTVVLQGADELAYSAVASNALSGNFNDIVQPMGDLSNPSFPLNTSVVGPRTGQVQLTSTSQQVANPSILLTTTGTVVRPSNASFSSKNDVDLLNLPLSYDADTGVQTFNVDVHNLGFDSLQALLDVDSVSSLSSPFGFVGGTASGIGSAPATLQFAFDTTGLTPGEYNAPVTIFTSDENLPGESTAQLTLNISVTIGTITPCPADIAPPGGNAIVNVEDLLAIIGAWGSCANPNDCPADIAPIGGDDMVNVEDLLAVIGAWGACP